MSQNIGKKYTEKMRRNIDAMENELLKLRTGRASPALLNDVHILYHGVNTPINQIASVTVEDARTLLISPWEKQLIPAIEKSLLKSSLGVTPKAGSDTVRVPLPALTQETRNSLRKQASQIAEKTRVAIRNARRDANSEIKSLFKKKEFGEDEERRLQNRIQKLTDEHVAGIDKLLAAKHRELEEI